MKTQGLPIVLMADDDEDDRMVAKDAFAASGAEGTLHCVEDGVELMSSLFNSRSLPSLILLDLNMPRKDGREALKEVKSIPQFQGIPVVVLTTSQEEKDKAYSLELGAASFITKPATFGEWIRMMKSLSNSWLVGKE